MMLVCAPLQSVAQQQPTFQRGFAGAGSNANGDPDEANAYASAIAEPDPNQRVNAIRQFLLKYPNSSLRQPAISQMMMARRDSRGTGLMPSASTSSEPAQPAAEARPAAPEAAPETPAPTGTPRNSLLQQAPQPAEISILPHSLAIKANNSALSAILHEISSSTGMKIDGLGNDERVFGNYGPGDAREVLLALLQGSGYNVLMVGDVTGGAPRQLSLTQRTMTTTSTGSSVAKNTNNDDDSDDSDQDVQQIQQPEPPQPMNQPSPGGIGSEGGGPQQRNPQEIIQDLQRLRQQQNPQNQ